MPKNVRKEKNNKDVTRCSFYPCRPAHPRVGVVLSPLYSTPSIAKHTRVPPCHNTNMFLPQQTCTGDDRLRGPAARLLYITDAREHGGRQRVVASVRPSVKSACYARESSTVCVCLSVCAPKRRKPKIQTADDGAAMRYGTCTPVIN